MVRRQSNFNRHWPGLGVRLASLVCVLILSVGTQALAFDERQNLGRGDGEEAVLGTFHLNPRDAVDQGSGPRRARDRSKATKPKFDPRSGNYSTADLLHMFADARAARDEGDIDEAQRLFERVIAVRPNSELADQARKDLAALDRNTHRRAGERDPEMPSVARRARSAPDPSGNVYGPTRSATRQPQGHAPLGHEARKQRSRRLVMLERQFIADVGDRIFFANGSSQLGARARAVLAAQADWLKAHPDIVVTIEGHADDGKGPRSEHHNLSLARSEAVRKRLMREGISETRIASHGRGGAAPVAVCTSASCAAQNRRVVTVISAGPIRIVGDPDALFGDRAPGPGQQHAPRSGGRDSRDRTAPSPPLRALR